MRAGFVFVAAIVLLAACLTNEASGNPMQAAGLNMFNRPLVPLDGTTNKGKDTGKGRPQARANDTKDKAKDKSKEGKDKAGQQKDRAS